MNRAFIDIWNSEPPSCLPHRRFTTGIRPLANATGDYGGYNPDRVNTKETWLRGGWYTDANGMVEVTTIYPGYYSHRCPHIHFMVHKDWIQSVNGFVHVAGSISADLD